MSSPIRHPASKSILLVWILNLFLPGLGNVYGSGLSALRWLVIGILIRVFVSHLGVLFAAYVLLSLIATGEIIAVSGLPDPTKKKSLSEIKAGRRKPKAINAPSDSLLSTLNSSHAAKNEELTDEFVRSHLQREEQAAAVAKRADAVNNLGYGDIRAGKLTSDTLDSSQSLVSSPSMPEPYQYNVQQYTYDSLDYKSMGTLPMAQGAAFTCPHCGINGQNDFSFCLSCGHAYAIG